MSQSVVMAIDPQPELLCALQEDLQQSAQKLEVLYAKSPLETLKKLKDSRLHNGTLTLLIVQQQSPRIENADLLQLVREMFPKVERFMLKVHNNDELPSCIPVPTAFVVCTDELETTELETTELETTELETALPDLQLLVRKS